jgi:hypothetical protein
MKEFNYWKKQHDAENLAEFNSDLSGLLWLKTKSIFRKELVSEFLEKNNIQLNETTLTKQFVELYNILSQNLNGSHQLLDAFIKEQNKSQVAALNKEQLVSELYKLKYFDWGDYQNDLNKLLVGRYVKVYKSYDELLSKFETEIHPLVQAYVLNSWYNHWSSILIEHIFKSHNKVLPTVGQVKSVDFFINDIPFDLKVTYLPSEFIKEKRAEKGHPVELTFLKAKAREANIYFDKNAKPNDLAYEIVEKMKDKGDEFCLGVLDQIKKEKFEILQEAQASPKILAKWLYENQSAPRFGSENRLYLVLVDTNDFANSWKLKRDLVLLEPTINAYLDSFQHNLQTAQNLAVTYNFPKNSANSYTSLTDVLFVVK